MMAADDNEIHERGSLRVRRIVDINLTKRDSLGQVAYISLLYTTADRLLYCTKG